MSRFYFIKQQETIKDGIACLAMIFRYHGKNYHLAKISEMCDTVNDGISMESISSIAERLGMHTIIGWISVNRLNRTTLPCILRWDKDHFVVLRKIRRGKYYVADPAKGLIKYNESEFREHWISIKCGDEEKGEAIFLKPTNDFFEHKDKDFNSQNRLKRYIKRILEYLKKTYETL